MGRRYRRRTALVPIVCSDVFNFAEKAGGDVIYKAANSDSLRNPRVRTEFLELLTDIFIDVFERVEIGGSNCGCTFATLDSGALCLFVRIHQAPVGVIYDHEILRVEQVVGYEQGSAGILC